MERICKVRILDEVSVVFVGLTDEHMTRFYNQFAVNAPNYFFNPNYKLGRWDGKIRYFHKTGKTFLYLIDEILPQLPKLGYKIVVEDLRPTSYKQPDLVDANFLSHILHIEKKTPIILRDDQVEGINALISEGYGICKAATGAGKTIMCSALVMAYDRVGVRSLTIVPDQTLIRQTKAEYINCQLDTGEYSGKAKTLEHKHVVSTWQALKNNPKVVGLFDMIIVDECHGLRGNVLQKIVTDHAGKIPYRFGFTGTLPKDESDKLSVHVAVGPVRFDVGARSLMDQGILANMDIKILQLEEDLKEEYKHFCEKESVGEPPTYIQFKDGFFGDFASEKSFLHRNEMRIEWTALYLQTLRERQKSNMLVLVDNIAFGRRLTAHIEGAIFVNGQDVKSASDRQEVYDLFKDHDDLIVVATVHIAGTGLNIPRIFYLVTIDIGKSFIRIIQAIGRGLRKANDKDRVEIIDICSDLKYSKRHLRQRTEYYREAGYPYKKQKIDYAKAMKDDV